MDQPQSSREGTSVSELIIKSSRHSTTCASASVPSALPNVAHHILASDTAARSPSADAATRSPTGTVSTDAVSAARARVQRSAVSAPSDPNARLSLPTAGGGRRPRSPRHTLRLLTPPDCTSAQPDAAASHADALDQQMRKCNIGDFADVEVESGQIVRVYTTELKSLGLIGAVICFLLLVCLLIRSHQQFSLFTKCTVHKS